MKKVPWILTSVAPLDHSRGRAVPAPGGRAPSRSATLTQLTTASCTEPTGHRVGFSSRGFTLTLCPSGQVGGDKFWRTFQPRVTKGLAVDHSTDPPPPHAWLLQALNPILGEKHFEMQKL